MQGLIIVKAVCKKQWWASIIFQAVVETQWWAYTGPSLKSRGGVKSSLSPHHLPVTIGMKKVQKPTQDITFLTADLFVHCPKGNRFSAIEHEIQLGKRDTMRNISYMQCIVFVYISCYIAEICIFLDSVQYCNSVFYYISAEYIFFSPLDHLSITYILLFKL